jgi:ParB/RepB/Spo0J family partition protein
MAAKSKKDFSAMLNTQVEMKMGSQKDDTISELETENLKLLERIKEFENNQDISDSIKINLEDIILVSNIRDELDYEEIEILSKNIKELGQLQPVLITKDNYLIAGYRRYNAVKLLENSGTGFLYALKLDKNYSEIDPILFLKIQYSENENRKSLDNFHLSKLFNNLKNTGKSQKEISEIFEKTKGTISSIIAIKNIHPELVKLLKEFQVYAWSKKKFVITNSDQEPDSNRFYLLNKGILGWQVLYSIAKHSDIEDQKVAFLKSFRNRLSEEELQSEFFQTAYKKFLKNDEPKVFSILKSIKYLTEVVSELNNLSEKEKGLAEKHLSNFQNIIIKSSEKIK